MHNRHFKKAEREYESEYIQEKKEKASDSFGVYI